MESLFQLSVTAALGKDSSYNPFAFPSSLEATRNVPAILLNPYLGSNDMDYSWYSPTYRQATIKARKLIPVAT